MQMLHLVVQLDQLIDPDLLPPGLVEAGDAALTAWVAETPDLLLWLVESALVRASIAAEDLA